jgi:hypothetical protein
MALDTYEDARKFRHARDAWISAGNRLCALVESPARR